MKDFIIATLAFSLPRRLQIISGLLKAFARPSGLLHCSLLHATMLHSSLLQCYNAAMWAATYIGR